MSSVETLETERLVLRPLRRDDLAALAELHAEPSFWRFPRGRGQTREETEMFLGRVLAGDATFGFGANAVVVKETGALAGWTGLLVPNFLPEILPAVEVGWRLGSRWHGLGYATEAGAACVRWGFESLRLERLVSIYQPANRPSGQVMARLGFEPDLVTAHPVDRYELHVTALSRRRWAHLVAAGGWPAGGAAVGRVSGS